MAKDLEIKVRLDRSQAKAATSDHIADAKKMAAATDAQVKAQKDGIAGVASSQKNSGDIGVKALAAQERANISLAEKAKGSTMAISNMAAGYATLDTASKVVFGIAGMWQAMRKDIEDSVDRVVKYKEKLLELASLKDLGGKPTEVLAQTIQLRAKTLQTSDEATAFQTGAMNSGQAAQKGGFINPANFKTLTELAGSYQAMVKADPKALGNLTGSLPMMIGSQNQSGEDAFRRMIGIFGTIQAGKSDLGPGVAQFEKNASLIGPGMFESPEELASIQSMFSLTSPNEADILVKQFARGTGGGLTKSRGTGFEGSIAQAEYLKDLGLDNQDGFVKIGKQIAADLKTQGDAVAGKTNDDGSPMIFNAMDYLKRKGVEDQDTSRALMIASQQINSGAYGKTFEPRSTPASAPTIQEAVKPIDEFQAASDVANARKSSLALNQASSPAFLSR